MAMYLRWHTYCQEQQLGRVEKIFLKGVQDTGGSRENRLYFTSLGNMQIL